MYHKFINLKANRPRAKKISRRKKSKICSKRRSSATQYLLYKKRIKDAELLRGNPTFADRLIVSSRSENPYYSIVLSFRNDSFERPKARQMLFEIMDSYESMLFAGLDPSELCYYWVLHTDHDRFELHLIVVNLHLASGKVLKLAWKKNLGDRTIFKNWQELINIAYQLPSPFDPAHERLLSKPPDKISKDLIDDFYKVDRHIAQEIRQSRITSREEIVKLIEDLGYKATAGKNYFSVTKNSEGTFRLRGRKYESEFDFLDYYRRRKERSEHFRAKEQVLERENKLIRDYEISIAKRRERLAEEHLKPRQGWKPIHPSTQNTHNIKPKDNTHEIHRDKEPLCWSVATALASTRLSPRRPRNNDGHADRNQRRKQVEVPTTGGDLQILTRRLRGISLRIKLAKSKIRRYFERRERFFDHLTKPSRWTMFRRKPKIEPILRPPERLREFNRRVDPKKGDIEGPDL